MRKFISITKIIGILVMIVGCSSDETPSGKEKLLKKLTHTWQLTSATMDDVTVEGYESFELTLSGSSGADVFTYGVTGRPELSPWPAGGMWEFGASESTQIIRDPGTDDELTVTYTVSETTLEIRFQFNGTGYESTRVSSASGYWVFSFSKK